MSGAGDLLPRIRAVCLALPEVTERLSHSAPAWFIKDKSTFATLWVDGHHAHGFPQLWCAAPAGAQEELIDTEPGRFFRPPYVGGRGWVGVRLDIEPDWLEIAGICQEAYRVVAPKRLVARLDAGDG